jgi:ATP-dependent DNA helicase RecQ
VAEGTATLRHHPGGFKRRIVDVLDAETLNAELLRHEERRRQDETRLEQMVLYGQSTTCRWKILLDYFDPNVARRDMNNRCGSCDACEVAA